MNEQSGRRTEQSAETVLPSLAQGEALTGQSIDKLRARIESLKARQFEMRMLGHPTDGFAHGSPEQAEWNKNASELLKLKSELRRKANQD